MSEVLTLAVILVAVFAAPTAVRLLVLFVSVLRVSYWPTKITPLAQANFAPDQQAAIEELEQLGFTQVAAYQFNTGPRYAEGLFFQHCEAAAFARLTFLGSPSGAYVIEFYSFPADGGMLVTVNRTGWTRSVSNPDIAVADAFAQSLAEHWEYHKTCIDGRALTNVEASEANSLTASYVEDALPFMAERGAVIEGPDGAWHPTLRSAWRMTMAWFKVRPNLAKPYHSSCTTGPHQSACFTRIYEQIEAVDAAKPPRPDVKSGPC